ncbi:MAG: DUF2848 domain-containing protein [Pseudolabrys sp.]
MPIIAFEKQSLGASTRSNETIAAVTIAGWTGRDPAAVEKHIRELEELGVKRPKTVPCYYTVTPDLLTTANDVAMLGPDSSGEAEVVLYSMNDGLWIGLGSDHTDRRVEAFSVSVSKQLCAKPVSLTLWRFDDVARHYDQLQLKSFIVEGGKRVPYQDGLTAAMRPPLELMAGAPGAQNGRLPVGTAMFCGTLAAIGGVRPASRFEMELHDPVLKRSLTHAYTVQVVPITGE